DSAVGAVHRAPSDFPGGKEGDMLIVEFTVLGIPVSASTAVPCSSTTKPSRSRSRPKIRKRRTATGTQSSVMAGRRATGGGGKNTGGFSGTINRAWRH